MQIFGDKKGFEILKPELDIINKVTLFYFLCFAYSIFYHLLRPINWFCKYFILTFMSFDLYVTFNFKLRAHLIYITLMNFWVWYSISYILFDKTVYLVYHI